MNAAPESLQPAHHNPEGPPARLLIVDDVPDNREVLTRRLLRRGFEVIEASGGQEALEILAKQDIDLMLLDIMMPDLTGTEVVRRVRQERSPEELPIVMVSALSDSQDISTSLALGANDYVTKPVDFGIALARISSQLERKRSASSERELRLEALARLQQESSIRRETEEQLLYLAYNDSLTGLSNRAAFQKRLDQALSNQVLEAKHVALILVDLDRFKLINDVYGHETGDQVLREAGGRLRACIPGALTVARLGGDEFAALLLDDGTESHALACAQNICQALAEPFFYEDRALIIGASCGVASASQCPGVADSILKAADLAMYRAKAAGRGQAVLFEPRFRDEQLERSALECDLRNAVRLGQLEVVYQPLLDARSRTIRCFEALARWRHPEKGMISPDIFISIAEETGIIRNIGPWVLRRACAEAATWPSEVRVAVNLSPMQFADPDLISMVANVLAETGLPARRLELEVTESGLLQAGAQNSSILQGIRQLGVRVAVDDFGVGYSSMSYLQNFVFDKLKIDRRFVRGLGENDSNSGAIIRSIASLGTEIGVDVTAEGVETEAQMTTVLSSGCSEVQGYLFSKPMPADQVRLFLLQSVVGHQGSQAPGSTTPSQVVNSLEGI